MDAPKHIDCLNKGKPGQFYRMAGTNNYKCKSCGLIASKDSFDPVEFTWKTEPESWAVFVAKNALNEDKVKEVVKVSKKINENCS